MDLPRWIIRLAKDWTRGLFKMGLHAFGLWVIFIKEGLFINASGPWVVKFKDGSFIIFLEIGIMGRLLSRGRLLIFTNEDSGVVY